LSLKKKNLSKIGKKLNKMKNEETEKGIIETYSSIISILKNMPGMKIEDVFASTNVNELEDEKKYLENIFNKNDN